MQRLMSVRTMGGGEGPLAETCMVHCGDYTGYVRSRKSGGRMRHVHDAPRLEPRHAES